MGPFPGSWQHEMNAPRGPRVGESNMLAARGGVMAREAAGFGAAALRGPGVPLPFGAPSPAPEWPQDIPDYYEMKKRKQRGDDLTPKITAPAGYNPVLPARRKAEMAQRIQEEEWREEQQQNVQLQQPVDRYYGAAVKLNSNEQLEHDATVTALRHELASTAIHMGVLEARRTKLMGKLSKLGEAY